MNDELKKLRDQLKELKIYDQLYEIKKDYLEAMNRIEKLERGGE